jgi:hypothetical protein
MIDGEADVAGYLLKGRDAVGITESTEIEVTAKSDARLLIIEVPMHW